jgi:2-C-methyl-D-erythritol 4-phosphate cytidylyltransferase
VGVRLGVVPVLLDDPEGPMGCAALRVLRGSSLVHRAAAALARSGVADRVVVAVPEVLLDAVTAAVAQPPIAPDVRVVPAARGGLGHEELAALVSASGDAATVVVHDPRYPLARAALAGTAVRALEAPGEQAAAVVPVRPVTDTLKWVDADGAITGTADRDRFRLVCGPAAYRTAALVEALRAAPTGAAAGGAESLPRLVREAGGRVIFLPAPSDVLRVATAEDVVLAEAMLDAGAEVDQAPARG